MKNKQNLIDSWFNKANKDLLSAEHEISFKDAVYESICFHCQQSVEKYLKGYLVYLGIEFEKIHEIGKLMVLCSQKDNEITRLIEDADKLTDYAVDIRYPDDWYEPTTEESKEAIYIAKLIRDYILNKVKL